MPIESSFRFSSGIQPAARAPNPGSADPGGYGAQSRSLLPGAQVNCSAVTRAAAGSSAARANAGSARSIASAWIRQASMGKVW